MIKEIFITIIIAFSLQNTFAQDLKTDPEAPKIVISNQDSVLNILEEIPKPEYDWSAYLSKNLKYPRAALGKGIQGKVIVRFIVEIDGTLSNPEIIQNKDIGHGIPEEVIRIILEAPKWTPGRQNGQNVRSYMNIPLTFKMG
ncbi:MAG TPA: energy transducer TonB [Edaphocola sp.]|nr:energy transducer TonB [Edaphocola sp.]